MCPTAYSTPSALVASVGNVVRPMLHKVVRSRVPIVTAPRSMCVQRKRRIHEEPSIARLEGARRRRAGTIATPGVLRVEV